MAARLPLAALALQAFTAWAVWAPSAACRPRGGAGPWGDALGLFQLSVARGQVPAERPVELCVVRDNHCLDTRLEAAAPAPAPAWAPASAEIVVTRSGEDVRWLDALPEVPAVIYDRGGASSLLPQPRENLRVVPQANTGREDDEMLRHIIEAYDSLPNVTVFLQGWPLLHCAGVVDTVRRALTAMAGPEPGAGGVEAGAAANRAAPGLVPISRTFYEYSMSEGLLGMARAMAEAQETGEEVMERALVLYAKTCRQILGRPCPDKQWVAEGAQWAVSRERIRSQPLQLYVRALELGEGYQGKLRGLVLEAIWPVLWGAEDWRPHQAPAEGAAALLQAGSTALLGAAAAGEAGPEDRALRGGGQGEGQGPDEAWCRAWWWTWVCDAAGMPKEQHRRRRRRINPFYGAYAKRTVRASGPHCGAADESEALLWSCEDRMAFCALQQRSAGPGASRQFVLQRPRFHMQLQAAEAAPGGYLEMLVRLGAPLIAGAPRFVEAASEGLRLRSDARGTQWYLADARGGRYSLSTAGDGRSFRYLACDAAGRARLGADRASWEILAAPDGYVRLRCEAGMLQFQPGPAGHLQCLPSNESTESVFSLHLEEHVLPDLGPLESKLASA